MHTKQVFGTVVNVIDGDIARVPADALLTAINSGGMWFGGIDSVIFRAAGDQFHSQAARALSNDPSTKAIHAPGSKFHNAGFRSVVFTIDDLDEDLKDVTRRGLEVASAAGYRTVSLPAIRLGVMKDIGGSQSEKVASIVSAIKDHIRESESPLNEISIVIYDDLDLSYEFELALR